MSARFDHLVVAVEDLDEAAARWRAAGLRAERGGAHPVGTENVLVRGPGPAYVELIAAGSEESNPWLDRVRSARGPISWAIAVDDVDAARQALVEAGFDPQPVVDGSRRTPDGGVVAWRLCDVGEGPYDGTLPFLIQWTTPMGPGPADGAIVAQLALAPTDADRLADLLLAVGFVSSRHWPRRMFHEAGTPVVITLGPADESPVSLTVRVPHGGLSRHTLDGVAVTTFHDRRRFAAAALQPSVGSCSARDRADAWVQAVVAAGLGAVEATDVAWATTSNVEVVGTTRLRGPDGTQPITVARGTHPSFGDDVVVIGVGDPVEVLERQPEWGATDDAHEVACIDDAFVLALSGGVYVVREGEKVVTRGLDGRRSDGLFADGEAEQWLADAAAGRRTDGVVRGDAWL